MTWRVLVVDDNAPSLALARFLLLRAGFEVNEASSALEAKAKLREFRPHLVLMDVQMPQVDGVTAMQQLKADPHTAEAIVVAFTSYAMKGDRDRLVAAGFDGYIAKPIDVSTFADQVSGYLPAQNDHPRR